MACRSRNQLLAVPQCILFFQGRGRQYEQQHWNCAKSRDLLPHVTITKLLKVPVVVLVIECDTFK